MGRGGLGFCRKSIHREIKGKALLICHRRNDWKRQSLLVVIITPLFSHFIGYVWFSFLVFGFCLSFDSLVFLRELLNL